MLTVTCAVALASNPVAEPLKVPVNVPAMPSAVRINAPEPLVNPNSPPGNENETLAMPNLVRFTVVSLALVACSNTNSPVSTTSPASVGTVSVGMLSAVSPITSMRKYGPAPSSRLTVSPATLKVSDTAIGSLLMLICSLWLLRVNTGSPVLGTFRSPT